MLPADRSRPLPCLLENSLDQAWIHPCPGPGYLFRRQLLGESVAEDGASHTAPGFDPGLAAFGLRLQLCFQAAFDLHLQASPGSNVVSADAKADLLAALQADCEECSWRLCGLQ